MVEGQPTYKHCSLLRDPAKLCSLFIPMLKEVIEEHEILTDVGILQTKDHN